MPVRKRRFVAAMGKSDAQIERAMWEKRTETKFKPPSKAELLSLKGAYRSGKRIVLDWENEASSKLLHQLHAIISLSVPPFRIHRVNAERLAVVRQLNRLGYRLAVPIFEELHDAELVARLKGHAHAFKARAPPGEPISPAKKTKQLHSSIMWARDLWKKVGEKRVKRFDEKGNQNPFGEEGKSLNLPNKVILAHKSLAASWDVNRLKKLGYLFFFTEGGEAYSVPFSEYLKMPVFQKHDHVDLFVGSAGKVLLVDSAFYFQERKTLAQVAKATGQQIELVPRSEEQLHPANFLVLEPGKILMDRDAKETIALMRSKGIEVVPTAVSMRSNRAIGGNVRCIINEL